MQKRIGATLRAFFISFDILNAVASAGEIHPFILLKNTKNHLQICQKCAMIRVEKFTPWRLP